MKIPFPDMENRHYEAFIDNIEHVYDGDTVNHVHIKIWNMCGLRYDAGQTLQLFPEVYVRDDALWIYTAVRLLGIDCPEFHPHHRLSSGELRDPADIEWEHELATKARDKVRKIIQDNDLKFFVGNPQEGKYAGRIVGEIWARDHSDGRLINVSEMLLTKKLAVPYDGGTKSIWTKPK